jgi:membrane protein implicated in regulation of membrane protease activity
MANTPSSAIALITAGVLFLVFGTPVRALWANVGAPWWLVYVLWSLGVVGLFVAERKRSREEPSASQQREEHDS